MGEHRPTLRQRGNIALLMAILIIPLVVLMGGSLDLIRATTARASLQQALDAAVLAASALDQPDEAEAVVTNYFRANIASQVESPEDVELTIVSDINESGKTVTASASYAIPTYFLPLIGMSELDVSVTTGGQQGWQKVEISLVLDVSGSMNNNGKISSLRVAAKDFVDIILTDDVIDLTSISVVPFATHVNTGDEFTEYLASGSVDDNKDNNFSDGHRFLGCFDFLPADYSIDGLTLGGHTPLPEWQYYQNCPSSNNKAVFLKNDVTFLKDMIDDLEPESCPACYTSIDEGATIGFKALSPDMQGHFSGTFSTDRPTEYDGDTIKAIVIMSDGSMSKFYRPVSCWDYTTGCSSVPISNAQAEASLIAMCDAARAEGIIVFTVGFQVSEGSQADIVLSSCAADSAHYFLVEDSDLAAAFSQIAGFIRSVRIVG